MTAYEPSGATKPLTLRKRGVAVTPDVRDLVPALLGVLRAAVGEAGEDPLLLPDSEQMPLHLFMHAATSHGRPARELFASRLRELAERLRALVAADRMKRAEGRKADSLRAAMGTAGSRLVDAAALANVLGPYRGAGAMNPRRRKRVGAALDCLEQATGTAEVFSPTLVHDGSLAEAGGEALDGWRVIVHEDPCAAACELFDAEAGKLGEVLGSLRVARL